MFTGGGMHGREWGGAYMAGGMCGRRDVWGGMHSGGACMAVGVCMTGGMHGGGCVAGGAWQGGVHATYAPPRTLRDTVGQCTGGTHPTGMHSCTVDIFTDDVER